METCTQRKGGFDGKMEPRAGFEFALHGVDIHEVPRSTAYEAVAITPKPPRLSSTLPFGIL